MWRAASARRKNSCAVGMRNAKQRNDLKLPTNVRRVDTKHVTGIQVNRGKEKNVTQVHHIQNSRYTSNMFSEEAFTQYQTLPRVNSPLLKRVADWRAFNYGIVWGDNFAR